MIILHLYYDSMNLYGEYANVEVLKRHLEDQGMSVIIDKRSSCKGIDFNDYDFIYIGSGTESAKKYANTDLMTNIDNFKKAIESNKVVLLTGNAMELLSNDSLALLDFDVEETDRRYTGDVIFNNNDIGTVVGFINKCSIINHKILDRLFNVEYADSNLDDIRHEGYRYKNVFGTHLIGPILVKNPCFMEYIIKLLIGEDKYKKVDYKYINQSYSITLNELRKVDNQKKAKN